ncbi:MAG: serine--tRNA ligase [Bacillota bacterium]|nr:serine--tRNA ligase [Bacillota bacterium]
MLDIKRIRADCENVQQALNRRGTGISLQKVLEADEARRKLLMEVEVLKAERNEGSSRMPRLQKEGKKDEADRLLSRMREVSGKIAELDDRVRAAEEALEKELLNIPNTPHGSVPDGESPKDNAMIRSWGSPRAFLFTPKPHWELGELLGTLDFASGAKVAGARFAFHKGLGARLERAIINFFMDTHAQNGYTEVLPPYLVNRKAMFGTGQLPKFEEDAFKVADTEYYLIPTAEVPVTNMYRECIIDGNELTLSFCAYSACFRSEAGSAGRDTRGLIRNHQFDKVELVKFTLPEKSYEELEKLTGDAERVLQLLGLPYRIVVLCAGDLGFCAAKTYDLEVWMPSYGSYVEISSCTNFEDYQARRADIKYRMKIGDKPKFVHTLNGSGLAVGRTLAAIMENYQTEDGGIIVPDALTSYMGTPKIG